MNLNKSGSLTGLKKVSIQIFFTLKIFLFCYWVLCIFWALSPNLIFDLEIFPPIPQIAFSLCLSVQKHFSLMYCSSIFFASSALILVSSPKDPCQHQGQRAYFLCFLLVFFYVFKCFIQVFTPFFSLFLCMIC